MPNPMRNPNEGACRLVKFEYLIVGKSDTESGDVLTLSIICAPAAQGRRSHQ